MLEECIAPLLLVAKSRNEMLYGKTRFQKLFFIFQKRIQRNLKVKPIFEFIMYHHGPYSKDLAHEIQNLVRRGLLEEGVDTTISGHDVFTYHLSTQGMQLVQKAIQKRLVSKEVEKELEGVVSEFSQMSLESLVLQAYGHAD